MGSYSRIAFKYFGKYSEDISVFFPDLKSDLKKAGIRMSAQEYVSNAALTTFIVFLVEIPIFSFIFSLLFRGLLFSVISGVTVSILFAVLIFVLYTKYPKTIINEKAKKLDATLPFASLYLSSIAEARLPIHKIFKIFGKFSNYGEITKEVNQINSDIEIFGFDTHTALERALERTPSKKFKELLWGVLSTFTSGGNIGIYLREKSKGLMEDYRRTLEEFSKKMMILAEIYLTAIILGAIFFIILTSIFSTIGIGGMRSIIVLQAMIIFVFVPLISVGFIVFIKASTPGGE